MLLLFRNFEYRNYWVLINAFWIRLRFVSYRFVKYRFVRYTFRFVRYKLKILKIPTKKSVCLQEVLKTSSRYVFKMSSRHVFKTSSRRLQRSNFRLPRCLQEVFKLSWKKKNFCAEDVLKTSLRHVLKTSSRRLEDQQMFAELLPGPCTYYITKFQQVLNNSGYCITCYSPAIINFQATKKTKKQLIFELSYFKDKLSALFTGFHVLLSNVNVNAPYGYTDFVISNTFIGNARLKLAKNQAKFKQHLEAELLLFKNFLFYLIHVII